jgi:hypothetical protein
VIGQRLWSRRGRARASAPADRCSTEDIHLKSRAMLAVRYLGEEIAGRYAKDAGWTCAFTGGDEAVLEQLAAIACNRAGISVTDYRKVYHHDLQLVSAQQRAIEQAILGA